MIGGIFLLVAVVVIFGIYSLIKGYNTISSSDKDSDKYLKGKNAIKTGIVIFIILTIAVLIGFSVCLSLI